MIIAINTRVLSENSTITQLVVDLFEMVAYNHPEHEFIYITEKETAQQKVDGKNVKWIALPQLTKNPLLWKLWYNYKLPSALKKIKATILVSPDGICSLRTRIPQCLFVNDLLFLHHPEWYSKRYLRFIKSNTKDFLQKAKTVITFSSVLKNEIIQQYSTPENKIQAIPTIAYKQYQALKQDAKEPVK